MLTTHLCFSNIIFCRIFYSLSKRNGWIWDKISTKSLTWSFCSCIIMTRSTLGVLKKKHIRFCNKFIRFIFYFEWMSSNHRNILVRSKSWWTVLSIWSFKYCDLWWLDQFFCRTIHLLHYLGVRYMNNSIPWKKKYKIDATQFSKLFYSKVWIIFSASFLI